ncbi:MULTISPECIES: Ni/Fe-hydrogenase, b-type cytochrome subunit [unclassified Pseudomonas]|uniref:Ni/Fe-hydrogenase, b-type cytochrome subunit n=1 Tax=unclassified Pseudomonas TaxID=196821 RepID=UPI002AC8CEB3|nr:MULTISPECIES: Ni/Fe-hydrogenase, b-type cytochrome subunit [unclassified Pseudomonas]MEB0041122.1 Ni/Fe-hydrogenase, b-type cytochrome subunit [Pseudomonas sp. MH10]MEB0078569.1 Ni/Fe-hydrogenase, b-type cytochrome subunit [Pseudomonas sp. MH10out]MEB0092131.1 Ni/Fe-hydrogenase, b-type cytochrome subunit [Pseudomonas sp. CCI4.2]MEB0100384.1 Ni/Fe-hydrogenase, b-type cytochrome subunit [Pseudomonas sp. CCI3.2]MEB0120306.1 Ni/Fe-hydrogenase, b-type cytochrome subunit [Pseudomonas sp. CCI1.2]
MTLQTETPMGLPEYVYEAPVRVWHWINAACILVLAVTGYLIGSPLATQPGEASAHFVMGYIRFAHFSAGYVFAIGLLGRTYWALVGNHHARELFSVPVLSKAYWADFYIWLRYYLFAGPIPEPTFGHNPLSRFAMFFVFLLTSIFMVLTGFALYGEGSQMGSWQERMFGWVLPLLGQSQQVHTLHHFGMWVILIFIGLHVYAAVREEINGRLSLIGGMISGYKTFKK